MDRTARQALLAQLQAIAREDHSVEGAARTVDAYRTLAREDPETYTYRLGRNLFRLGERLEDAERFEEARVAADEAVAIFRERADIEDTSCYYHDLAQALALAAEVRIETDQLPEARALGEEAVALYRTIVAREPRQYREGLIASLSIQCYLLLVADGPWAALSVAYEALTQASLLDSDTVDQQPALLTEVLQLYERLCKALDMEADEDRVGAVRRLLQRPDASDGRADADRQVGDDA